MTDDAARLKEIREWVDSLEDLKPVWRNDTLFLLSHIEQLQQQLAAKESALRGAEIHLEGLAGTVADLERDLAAANVWKERWGKLKAKLENESDMSWYVEPLLKDMQQLEEKP